MTTDSIKRDLESIALQFVMNLRALRVFNDRIGAAAMEHDRSAVDSFVNKMKELFPEEFSNEESDSDIELESETKHDDVGNATASTALAEVHFEGDESESEHTEEVDPKRTRQILNAAKSLAKAAPVQSNLLRESGLVSLMSYCEGLIADLIHAFYGQFPEALPAAERTLSLAELRVIGSVEEAELFLTSKEVDSVLRESLSSQLQYFTKRFKVELPNLSENRKFIIEVAQRRNLLVHNKGIVNRTYLERVDAALIERYDAEKDKKMRVPSDYFKQAVDAVEVAGIVLHQQCWRKWGKDIDVADGFLINFTFDALVEERYDVVIEIAKYAASIPFKSESSKRRVCINHAIALRDSGRKDEIARVLGQYDWSGFQLLFQLALCAVRFEEEQFYRLLPRAIAAREVTKDTLDEWPLFRNFRDTERFREAVDSVGDDLGENEIGDTDD